ncbi:hypothetical protein BJF79_10590 [Actinomadura sp. CNU-125]|uniref:hypothetical protein n=1 Tax=Actinomadura sp. CNU-125 TaxID=1904961 RepID=UPI000959E517|nr:hypothetical protein [Actinomadura sp. CNU-125]OLT29567.1 hypothetical protein BJF79_10590 [Actinomadura sp. CNU-125]
MRLSSRILALAATAAAPLALGATALPAHAATTTWTVVNSDPNGYYLAESTGSMTIKNEAGETLVTCPAVTQSGPMADGPRTGTTAIVGYAETTIDTECTRPNGSVAPMVGYYPGLGNGRLRYVATDYDAATGTTTLRGDLYSPWGITVFGDNCKFAFGDVNATYNNNTQILKYTTGTALPYTTANEDGSTGCPGGVDADGETVTFTGEFKVTSPITITRTVS